MDTDTDTNTDTDIDIGTGTNTDIGTGTGTDPETDTDRYTDTDTDTDGGLTSGRTSGLLLRSLYIPGRGDAAGEAPLGGVELPLHRGSAARGPHAEDLQHDRVRSLGPVTHVHWDMCSLSDIVASQCACRFEGLSDIVASLVSS
jgi:hypothetical protein